jgi:hypothetical protein
MEYSFKGNILEVNGEWYDQTILTIGWFEVLDPKKHGG